MNPNFISLYCDEGGGYEEETVAEISAQYNEA